MAEEVKPQIVEGVAAMTAAGALTGGKPKTNLAVRIEKAMAQAVQDAYSKGITKPDDVRALMLAARDAEVAK